MCPLANFPSYYGMYIIMYIVWVVHGTQVSLTKITDFGSSVPIDCLHQLHEVKDVTEFQVKTFPYPLILMTKLCTTGDFLYHSC